MVERRPITDAERPFLADLGRELRLMRTEYGLSQAQVADGACVTAATIGNLEHGRRRTRRSTLERIVATIVDDDTDEGRADTLALLVEMAGPTLAQENRYAERRVRNFSKRARRRRREFLDRVIERGW